MCYSTILDSTDISISNKGKTSASTNNVKAYSKKTLGDKIYRLTTTNAQLMTNKIKTEKTRVNLEVDRVRLFDKKNSLVVKREELRTEIAILNAARLFNVLVRRYQDLFLRLI